MTLVALQTYEWAVSGILLVLHRWRRAPEDEPSLLLVAAIFWTGPLAATTELGARDAHHGMLCAIAVGVFATMELLVVPRGVMLRMGWSARVQALLALLLLIVAPRVLHVYDDAGTDEVFLYGLLVGARGPGFAPAGLASGAHR